jgi:hypothetical protein
MPHGIVDQPVVPAPVGGPAVELGHPLGARLPQAHAQQVGEQAVVAVPAAPLVQGDQEQVGALEVLQRLLPVAAPGDRVAERAAEALEDRGVEQEVPQLSRLPLEDLPGQVVEDVAVAAAEPLDQRGRVGASPQGQGGQLQAGHPPLGAVLQRCRALLGEVQAPRLPQQGDRFLAGEPQVLRADLSQLPPGTHPRQRQRRVGAPGDHHVHAGRQVLQQEGEAPVDRVRLDDVIVVEHQGELARTGRQLVHQGRDHGLGRRLVRGVEQREDLVLQSRVHLLDRGHHVAPQAHRVVVVGVQRDPAHRPPGGPGPLGEQGRLPEPRGGAHQQQLTGGRLLDPVEQARAGKDVRAAPRHAELGRQEDVALPGRLTHAASLAARVGRPVHHGQLVLAASAIAAPDWLVGCG